MVDDSNERPHAHQTEFARLGAVLPSPSRTRRGRAVLTVLAGAVAVTVSVASPALATAPAQWDEPQGIPFVHGLLVFAVIPLSLFALIVLLVYVPSLARGESYQPGLAWRSEPEWFGGPHAGVEAVDRVQIGSAGSKTDRGGASARW